MMTASVLTVFLAVSSAAPPDFGRATDWMKPASDTIAIAVADVDGDGFGDVLAVNAKGRATIAYSVNGWKSAAPVNAFTVPAEDFENGEQLIGAIGGMLFSGHDGQAFDLVFSHHTVRWVPDEHGKLSRGVALPLPDGVRIVRTFARARGDFVLIDDEERAWLYTPAELTPLPAIPDESPLHTDGPPFDVNAEVIASTYGDVTGDGVRDTLTLFESRVPTRHRLVRMAPGLNEMSGDADDDGLTDAEETEHQSDPANRDTDGDGLLDGWEVHGLPRGIGGFDTALSPTHQDVIVSVTPYIKPGRAAVEKEINKSKRLYAALPNENPDGTTGITLHYRFNDELPEDKQGSWRSVGPKELKRFERGILHWMQVTPAGGGQTQQTGVMGQAGNNWAAFAHEVGHQLGLSHTGDSSPAWCPIYGSIMNYAYNYTYNGSGSRIQFSEGRFASIELDENALVEHLPFPMKELEFLSKRPYRFPLKDDGNGGTFIDWNQNGQFDEGTVVADINYGGSTNAGTRRWQDRIGAQPFLAYVGETCLLLSIDLDGKEVSLRNYLGREKWSEHRALPDAEGAKDLLLIGGGEWAQVFMLKDDAWSVARVNAETAQPFVALPGLPAKELSGVEIDGRTLLIARDDDDDDHLDAYWLEWDTAPTLTPIGPLDITSQVPPALAVNPIDRTITLVTTARNAKETAHSMRITTLTIEGDAIHEGETIWSRGENSGHQCTTRPVAGFTEAGELIIFHTGAPRSNRQMHVYRTRRIGNTALDHGWLSCMMYDEWTRTLVGPAFALGPQGAIYGFRWDSGRNGDLETRTLGLAHNALGIDSRPMRDHNDSAKMSQWGIRHSILYMERE